MFRSKVHCSKLPQTISGAVRSPCPNSVQHVSSALLIYQLRHHASSSLTHVNHAGEANMVSIAGKNQTHRIAIAQGQVQTNERAISLILDNSVKKGDVLATARLAGIMASKRTSELIPLCHNIALSKVSVDLKVDRAQSRIMIETRAECVGSTGVEMEALMACSMAGLTIYDMLKAVDKTMVISNVRVTEKQGGKSGDWKLG